MSKAILTLALLLLLAACAADQTTVDNPLAYTCPKGLSDDPAPGSCGNFVDRNGDGVCDRSQGETIPAQRS